jgi:hypothetical protein
MASTQTLTTAVNWKNWIGTFLLDGVALAFIFLMPAISHMLSIKLYMVEPMRLMLILALVHTHKKNAYLLAVTLPLFSFLISTHPVLFKAALIAAEMVVNVAVFYFLVNRMHKLGAIFASIWISKLFYYVLKYFALQTAVLSGAMFGIPIWVQLATSAVFSVYLFLMYKKPTN